MKRTFLTTTTLAALIAAPAFADIKTAGETQIDTQKLQQQAEELPKGTKPMIDVAGKVYFADEGFERVSSDEVTINLVDGVIAYDENEKWVGEVGSVLVDDQGNVVAAVIDVGGFLGIGEKEVAIAIEDMTVLHNADENKTQVVVNASESELKKMPAYEL